LQYFVDEQNNKAFQYKKDFHNWIQEKLEHKIWKKHFPGQNKTQILPKVHKDEIISEKRSAYEKEIKNTNFDSDQKNKQKIYTAIKRVFNKEITRHE